MLNLGGESQPIYNTFHYACQDPFVPSDTYLGTWIVAWKAALNVSWIAFLSAGYVSDGVDLRYMDDSTTSAIQYGAALALDNGGVGGAATAVAPNLTGYIKLGTAKRGKSFRGSKHFSPLDESLIEQGQLNPDGLVALTAIKTALLVTLSVGGHSWFLTVMSASLSALSNPTNIIANQVTSAKTDVNKTLGNQKSRKFRRLFI